MDTILYNGIIHTMAGRDAEALAIKNGRLAMVGENEAVLALKTADTRLVDLAGKCVLPGFVDSHMHIIITGIAAAQLDLQGVTSPEEILQRGKEYLAAHELAEDEWIIGYGFDHHLFNPPVLPDRTLAEAISDTHPVLLDRVCGHVGIVNSLALARAGYDENTVIPGGTLEKGPDGRLNGILYEAALDQMKHAIPRLKQEQVEAILRDTGGRMAAAGLTGVHSDDVGPEGTTWEALSGAVARLEAENTCPLRIWEEWEAPTPEALSKTVLSQPLRSFAGSDFLKVCNIKLISDGSLGAHSAYMRSDYSDEPGNRGIAVYTQEAMDELVMKCHQENLQVACHAIGDGACEMFVKAVEKAMQADPKPLHHRVVHCQCGAPDLYRRMAALDIGADIQPAFVPTDAAAAEALWGDRARTSYAWKTLLEAGVHLGGGSDCPVEHFSPLWGIYCAVNRPRVRETPAAPFLPEECLTVQEAAALYTTGPAYLSNTQADLGTLEAGKLADLTVLDRDIFTIPKEELLQVSVVLTMVGGRVTFDGRNR